MTPIQISIADDHPMVVEGLCNIMARYPQFSVMATYNSGATLLAGLQQQQPEVLLLDLQFPDSTGSTLLPQIKTAYPQISVLIITSVEDPYDVQEMMRLGASGYVRKTIAPDMLAQAIEQLHYGHTYIDPELKELLVRLMLDPEKNKTQEILLSERELAVLQLIGDGLSNMDIGSKLFLSHRTIENYKAVLYEKFGVNNSAHLIKLALKRRFIK